MTAVQEHTTPDGALRFVVWREDGDTILGFDGYEWHTHGDLLTVEYELAEDAAVDRFVSDLVGSRLIIAVSRVAGRIDDVWVTDSQDEELQDNGGGSIRKPAAW